MRGVSAKETIHILENQIRTFERELADLRQRAETAERERDEAREALRLIIDEAHSSERNSVDSLIEIIDIAGRALGEES